jgi:hypothetical protein
MLSANAAGRLVISRIDPNGGDSRSLVKSTPNKKLGRWLMTEVNASVH